MKELLLIAVFLTILIYSASGASLNLNVGTTPINSWVGNQTIHYRFYNRSYSPLTTIQINPTLFNFTETYNNYYYLDEYSANNTSVGTIYRLGTIAYPQSFIVSMLEHNFSACDSNSLNGSTSKSFFSELCGIYDIKINATLLQNESPQEANSTIQALVAETMPDDIFTKQLYSLYDNYSSVCNAQGEQTSSSNASTSTNGYDTYNVSYNPNKSSIFTLSECQGSKTDPAFPYFLDYMKYIMSLSDFMNTIDNYTPNMLYYSIYYDMKNFNLFPVQKTPELIQSNIALMGVYPGMIPSGLDAEKMLNYSSLGLPINYFKNNNISALTKNGIIINSGIYNNITMFVALRNAMNPYSYYNITASNYPFSNSLNSGSIQYANSCSSGIGLGSAEQEEEQQMKKSAYNTLASFNLYPGNQYSNMASYGNSTYYSYGPSIIGATPKNVEIGNNNVVYGAKYYNGSLAYENSTNEAFASNQTLLSLNIPTNSLKNINNVHQLFAELDLNYSYTMNYYGFNTYFSSPRYNITHSQYQETKLVKEKNKTVQVEVTCYTSSVSGAMNYTSSKILVGSKNLNYSFNKETFVNVSTNITAKNVFKTNKNDIPQSLNYSYVLYQSSSPKIKSFSNITIPSGTTFQIYTLNNTPLEEFTASYASNTTITGAGAKNLFLYAPTYVFPDTYQGINYYYPTISSYANNNQYMLTFDLYKLGLKQNSALGLGGMENLFIDGVLSTISHYVFGYNFTNSPAFQVVSAEHEAQQYYLEGCPYTRIGNLCVSPPPQYTLSNNQTTSQSDYNLLNPILYTQNMFYSNAESSFWVCSKVAFWKTVLLDVYPSVETWTGCNYNYDLNGINELYFTNMQLAFNETWNNFTPQEKTTFYNYLVNNSTYDNNSYYGQGVISGQYSISSQKLGSLGVYSTVFPPTLTTMRANLSANNNFTIGEHSVNMNISGSYSGLRLDECVFDMCYSTDMNPTKIYTMINYKYTYIGNNTFEVSVYPNEYEKESILLNKTIKDPTNATISFTYSISKINSTAITTKFNAPSTFYIKEIISDGTNMYYSNNTLYVDAPDFTNYDLNLSFSHENLPPLLNGSFTFVILKQNLDIDTNVSNHYNEITWIAIVFIIIIIIILQRIRYFQPLKDEIKYRMNRIKES